MSRWWRADLARKIRVKKRRAAKWARFVGRTDYVAAQGSHLRWSYGAMDWFIYFDRKSDAMRSAVADDGDPPTPEEL